MLPTRYHDLLEAPHTGLLATLLPDGSPQASPAWFWFDGEHVHISTTTDRQKHRNVVRDPRVTLTIEPTRLIQR